MRIIVKSQGKGVTSFKFFVEGLSDASMTALSFANGCNEHAMAILSAALTLWAERNGRLPDRNKVKEVLMESSHNEIFKIYDEGGVY